MKMISTTSSTSISGVTLIYGTALTAPAFFSPSMDMNFTPLQETKGAKRLTSSRRRSSGSRGSAGACAFLLVRHQADLINTERSDFVNHRDHVSITDAYATLDVNDFVFFFLDRVQHLFDAFLQ